MALQSFSNPFTPGAGHFPPHLAGREKEIVACKKLFEQEKILKNIILTGLRGVGKTVLLTRVKPIAQGEKWLWCGTDMSESASVSEAVLATRILTDLSVTTSGITIKDITRYTGFSDAKTAKVNLNFDLLNEIFIKTPGLISDKLKSVLESVWQIIHKTTEAKGIIFAYDEVQTLADHVQDKQYPLSLLLDVFQSLQRKNIPFMLLLTGLPTLFPNLVAARTYSERMFEIIFLDRLSEADSKEAIERPIKKSGCPVYFTPEAITAIITASAGYPYFIQFIAKEVFDVYIQQAQKGQPLVAKTHEVLRKLDSDFFAGRWSQLSDRQMDLLRVIANLESCQDEFTIQEIVEKEKTILEKPFSSSHIIQMLCVLSKKGIIYKNRHGKYLFAVPLFDKFIKRQVA